MLQKAPPCLTAANHFHTRFDSGTDHERITKMKTCATCKFMSEDCMDSDGEFSVEDARAILQELREWRSGKRRVFFRVGRTDYFGESYEDDCVRKPRKKEDGVSVTKVFVRPKGAKK